MDMKHRILAMLLVLALICFLAYAFFTRFQ